MTLFSFIQGMQRDMGVQYRDWQGLTDKAKVAAEVNTMIRQALACGVRPADLAQAMVDDAQARKQHEEQIRAASESQGAQPAAD